MVIYQNPKKLVKYHQENNFNSHQGLIKIVTRILNRNLYSNNSKFQLCKIVNFKNTYLVKITFNKD